MVSFSVEKSENSFVAVAAKRVLLKGCESRCFIFNRTPQNDKRCWSFLQKKKKKLAGYHGN